LIFYFHNYGVCCDGRILVCDITSEGEVIVETEMGVNRSYKTISGQGAG